MLVSVAVMPDPVVDRTLDDRRCIAGMIDGDEAALRWAYERFSGMLFGVALKVTCDIYRAEDVVQEVFADLWRAPARVDLQRGSLRTYLCTLAHNRSVGFVRSDVARQKRERRVSPPPSVAWLRVTDPTCEIVDADACERARRATVRAVNDLPAGQREAIVLAFYNGQTYRQVAVTLGVPEGTAKKRIRTGMRTLAGALSEFQYMEG